MLKITVIIKFIIIINDKLVVIDNKNNILK